jgi:translocation and assembly module TamB
MNFKSETVTGGITAVITLSGPVDKPEIAFSSVPALPSDEILSRVLFGASASQLTPYQALRLAMIADTLARGGDGFSILGRMRRIMNIDRLELSETDGEEGTTAVSAGKYLSDDLYIEVKKGVSDRSTTFSVEKQVSRHISVESDVGTQQGPGLGIRFRWDY